MALNDWLFLLIVLASNVVQGVTGFAGTMLAMPPSMLLIGAVPAKAALNLFGLLASVMIAVRGRRSINWRVFLFIVCFMGIGLAAAPLLESLVPASLLTGLYGGFLIVFAAIKLFGELRRGDRPEQPLPLWLGVITLLSAGVIHGLFVSGGALLVVYASQRLRDKGEFRATLAPVWVVLNGILLINHAASGSFDKRTLLLCAAGLVPLVLGIIAGGVIHDKVSRKGFLLASYGLLIINGIALLISIM